jgi:hypothetical protein
MVITAVVAALIAMQVYLKRGVQGKIKTSADSFGGQQYEPKKTTSDITTQSDSHVITTVTSNTVGNMLESTTFTNILAETQHQYGNETVLP